jgi:hypothetical protein
MGPASENDLQMLFVPMRNRIQAARFECGARPHNFEPSRLFMANAQGATAFAPTMEVYGLAFWSGGVHDLPIKRRGLAVMREPRVKVAARSDIHMSAAELPTLGGGWFNDPVVRDDGRSSRLTGPESRCELGFDFDSAPYEIAVHVLGAGSADTLLSMQLEYAGSHHPFRTTWDSREGLYRSTADIIVSRAGPANLALVMPEMRNGYGIELVGMRIRSVLAEH